MFIRYTALLLLFFYLQNNGLAQTNLVTYAGNSGQETFYDVSALSDGTFLVAGAADDLNWIAPAVPRIELAVTGVANAQGLGKIGFLLQISPDLQQLLRVAYFAPGVVEDIRFIKTTELPHTPTGAIYLSCTTRDTREQGGGYALMRLNQNFVDGLPSGCSWVYNVWAEGPVQENQPWDVGNDGKVVYLSGQSHAYDWAQAGRLSVDGQPDLVPQWRTHWIQGGGEFHGQAADYTGAAPLAYSGIVFKKWGRCDLRSWTADDFNFWQPDENGGLKKGRWPLDAFFAQPCDPATANTDGPGYTGYSLGATPVYGPECVAIDRRNNAIYLGLNVKTTLAATPDFEPAVIAMQADGTLQWWSRLYHEVTPAGEPVNSLPDQYIDALAIDYAHDQLVVDARCHGNNVENFWSGNQIAAQATANGFQNQFTGSSGNIHLSWLGKLNLADGRLQHSTFVGEYAEGTGGLGTPHPDPNLDGWPNPNAGWPNLNTTKLRPNALETTADGSVLVLGVGRRTITTANAYQKMVKPGTGGLSCWNSFTRVYAPDLSLPRYSSLVVGVWDTTNQTGGDNTELFGAVKTATGLVAVGRQKADAGTGLPVGNPLPVI
ncbi:MAG: hypothetical protein ABIQ93_12200, partial [Saprospiraceae bacterium]